MDEIQLLTCVHKVSEKSQIFDLSGNEVEVVVVMYHGDIKKDDSLTVMTNDGQKDFETKVYGVKDVSNDSKHKVLALRTKNKVGKVTKEGYLIVSSDIYQNRDFYRRQILQVFATFPNNLNYEWGD